MEGGRRVVALVLLLAVFARAQDDPFANPAEALATAKERLGKLTDPNSDEAKKWTEPLNNTVRFLEELIRIQDERKNLLTLGKLEERRAAAQQAIDELRAKPAPAKVELASPDDLGTYDEALAKAKADRDAARAAVAARTERLAQADKNRKDTPAREADAKRRLEENDKKDDDLSRYRAANARLELRMLRERTAFLDAAAPVWTALGPVLDLEADLARLRYERADARQKLAAAEAARLREEEAKRIQAEAAAKERAAKRAEDPVERFRLERAAEAARLKAEDAALKSRIDEINQETLDRDEMIAFVGHERSALETRLARGDEGTADLLRGVVDSARRSQQVLRSKLQQLYAQADANRKALVAVLDRIWTLELPPADNPELKKLLEQVPPDRQEEARQVFNEAVEGPSGVIPALRAKRATLETIETNLTSLTDKVVKHEEALDELLVFVQDRILWVRSEPPIDGALLSRSAGELVRLPLPYTKSRLWTEAGITRIVALGGLGIGIALLFLVGSRLRARAVAPPAPSGWKATTGRTLLGLVAAALPAAGFLGASLAVQALALQGTFRIPLRSLLDFFALILLIRQIAGFLLREGGFVVATLGLPARAAAQLLQSIRLLTIAALLLRAPAQVLSGEPFLAESLPRLLTLAWYGALGLALFLLVRRRGAIVQDLTRPGSWMRGLWGLVGLATAVLTLAAIGLDVLGYGVGAPFLMGNTARTVGLVILIAGFYSSLLALVNRIAARIRAHAMKDEGAVAAWRISATVVEELTQLVTAVVGVVAILLFLRFWGLSATIVRGLDAVHLISLADEKYVTLWNAVAALLWIFGGHFVVRNLSAVYDTILSPLLGKTDAAGRYVFLALSRYAILLLAYGLALLTLQVSFASIGWLLAAISFGVGFGLQEIVANFISGLILLLERPIRVGDFIEVDGTVAIVERINIRSTTVTNLDRQTIIIPNKQLITQNLTNWTRNDRLMRRKFRVGVAYGSDVEKVLRVLDEEVRRHPQVLRDPPPAIRFVQFGDSSLDFDVFFFATIEDGLQTLADLHRQVNDRFQKEGIEIPFPQRDLHLRSGFEQLGRGDDGKKPGPSV